jgi:magnesium chelatase family protein
MLRQPLEDGMVTIARAQSSITYPSRFMLVAAMNPCPCGYMGDVDNRCHCTEQHIRRYISRVSGPLLDRIDMHIEVARPDFDKINEKSDTVSSTEVRNIVNRAQEIQAQRFRSHSHIFANAHMGVREIDSYCQINLDAKRLLAKSVEHLGLSMRAWHKILKVARTIADLADTPDIDASHIAEAVQFRRGEVLI